MKKGIKKILIFFFVFLIISAQALIAEEKEDIQDAEEEELLLMLEDKTEGHAIYKYPEIAPDIYLQTGLRLLNQENAGRAYEFTYLQDSLTFHGLIHSFSYPHRRYLQFDFENEKDHFADLRYAYSDLLFFRWNNSAVLHNISNTDIPSGVNRNSNADYNVKNDRNNLFLRVKAHDFPFHLYLGAWQASRKGDIQQRSALGRAYYGGIVMTSQTRDVDWLTEIYTFGANSHLGPVEVDFTHKQKKFDAKRDKYLIDNYTTSATLPRPAGDYPHNLLPDLRGATNTLKIHSTYTGKIVASATFSHNARENKTSGADSDAYTTAGTIHWLPRNNLSFNLKYSHRDLSVSNPSSVTLRYADGTTALLGGNPVIYNPNASLSSKKDFLSLSGKYKPLPDLTLRAKYNFTEIKRTSVDLYDWNVQESTRYNTAVLALSKNFNQNLTSHLQYRFKHIENPSYNVEPDNSHEGEAKVSWMPHARVNLIFNYKLSRMERDDLHFTGATVPENRKVAMDNLLLLGTFTVLDNLSLTLSHSFIRYEIEQDIVYTSLNYGATYKDDGQIYTVSLHYTPLEKLQLTGEVTHVRNAGGFSDPDNLIGTYSQQDIQETFYRLSGEYLFAKGLTLGMEYAYAYFDDVLDNPYDSETDSKGHIIMFTLSKQW